MSVFWLILSCYRYLLCLWSLSASSPIISNTLDTHVTLAQLLLPALHNMVYLAASCWLGPSSTRKQLSQRDDASHTAQTQLPPRVPWICCKICLLATCSRDWERTDGSSNYSLLLPHHLLLLPKPRANQEREGQAFLSCSLLEFP